MDRMGGWMRDGNEVYLVEYISGHFGPDSEDSKNSLASR